MKPYPYQQIIRDELEKLVSMPPCIPSVDVPDLLDDVAKGLRDDGWNDWKDIHKACYDAAMVTLKWRKKTIWAEISYAIRKWYIERSGS